MAQNKMLIDATHPEETRVVVVRGNRVDEFDFESENKTQIRGNIYLAKVTRVEPSLQAAFVDYGGNRHGFLAFSEIHPDYYQIPIADRQALLDQEAAEDRQEKEEEEARETETKPAPRRRRSRRRTPAKAKPVDADKADDEVKAKAGEADQKSSDEPDDKTPETKAATDSNPSETVEDKDASSTEPPAKNDAEDAPAKPDEDTPDTIAAENESDVVSEPASTDDNDSDSSDEEDPSEENGDDNGDDDVESVGAEDAMEEVPVRRVKRRQYKIQEVIKRRQVILVQIAKEERGNKGAALTTYLSLAGRYSVLMPNTARGGGISRKITNLTDRKRLKTIASDLDVAEGMGVILRTAGASRTKAEIRRDFEYLLRLWENVRNLTLNSTAPCLVYEEGSLIKRSIRDLYDKDTGEILVAGDAAYREAKDFMRMLMPSHAKNIKRYIDQVPIFTRNNVETQLDKVLQPQVTLKSGGYLVINQTEALVAIDVNSGRSTRQHSIEDTATQTNLEAAEEVARQLRLRDLAGLIVIDFIDMEEKRNNRAVEKRLKDALKNDRARIQVSRISHFGLMEMSRQRIRASVLESTTQACPTCEGVGHVRSVSSIALFVLRSVEEYLLKNARHNITVKTSPETATYLLNTKRMSLVELEARFGLTILIESDSSIGSQFLSIERGDLATPRIKTENHVQPDSIQPDMEDLDNLDDLADLESEEAEDNSEPVEAAENEAAPKRKRRRRRRSRSRPDAENENVNESEAAPEVAEATGSQAPATEEPEEATTAAPVKRRRRGRRGGTNRSEANNVEAISPQVQSDEKSTEPPAETNGSTEEPGETVAAKPSRNRRPRSRKKVETPVAEAPGQAEEEAPAEVKAEAGAGAEVKQPESDEVEPPKRATRRPRKKPVADTSPAEADTSTEVEDAETPAPAPEQAPEPVTTKPARKPRRNTKRKATAETKAEAKSTDEAAPPAATEPENAEEEESGKDKDEKGGWWQRHSFF